MRFRAPPVLFNSTEFLFFFLIVLSAYSLLRRHWRLRKWLLLVTSYWFYMSWNAPFGLLLAGSTVLDYVAAIRIAGTRTVRVRRLWLLASCLGNLGVLAFFKYGEFIAQNVWPVVPSGVAFPEFLSTIVLPIGISFYTFQSLSYSIDVYRGEQEPTHELLDFAIYVAFFPQLIAGPIIRSADFLPQLLENRSASAEEVLRGIDQVARGLAKKVLIADGLAGYVDLVYGAPTEFGSLNLIIATYAYAFQIYCDFSGYSDIAIGVARILGFNVPVNFRLPYLARNPWEFWTRWHISLSSWLRDYLYIPLGGGRVSRSRTYSNLMITMLLGGLWHGASWNFVLWGAFHGIWLVVHRTMFRERDAVRGGWLAMVANFHLVCVGWVLFRAPTLSEALQVFSGVLDFSTPVYEIPPIVVILLGTALVTHLLGERLGVHTAWRATPTPAKIGAYVLLAMALYFRSSETVQFIYFQF